MSTMNSFKKKKKMNLKIITNSIIILHFFYLTYYCITIIFP